MEQGSQWFSSQQVSNLIAPLTGRHDKYVPPIDLEEIDDNPIEAKRILGEYNKRLQDSINNGKPLPNPFNSVNEKWLTPPLSSSLRIVGKKEDNTKEAIIDTIRGVAGVQPRGSVGSGVISRQTLAQGMFTAEQGIEAMKDKDLDI